MVKMVQIQLKMVKTYPKMVPPPPTPTLTSKSQRNYHPTAGLAMHHHINHRRFIDSQRYYHHFPTTTLPSSSPQSPLIKTPPTAAQSNAVHRDRKDLLPRGHLVGSGHHNRVSMAQMITTTTSTTHPTAQPMPAVSVRPIFQNSVLVTIHPMIS